MQLLYSFFFLANLCGDSGGDTYGVKIRQEYVKILQRVWIHTCSLVILSAIYAQIFSYINVYL